MKYDEKPLERIIERVSKEWQADARKAVKRLYSLLEKGKKTAEAIDLVRKEYPEIFSLPHIEDSLTEAAAYGYGIMPSILTEAQSVAWSDALDKPWDGSGMTLSKKLHGADMKMREAITDTIREQLKRNSAWTEAAKALYDGYEHGNIVRPQQLPKYLSAVRYATQGSPEALAEARKVFYNIERLSKSGAPTKSLKAAYSSLVRAAQTGTKEQLEKACYVAVQEKSRYVAQRIIRTELSRAYSDGFNAKIMQDDDVVAVRLRLSTRHPVFDICNLFAEADMYGLGKGVYPKDKMPPVPLHPHCMCRYEEVYAWEVDISKQKDNVKQAGDKWLNGLSDVNRRRVLGIEGDEAWKQGENWQKYMRNWRGTVEAETRLTLFREFSKETDITKEGFLLDKEVKAKSFHDKFYQVGLTKSPVVESMYREAREMLTHRSGTVFEDIVAIDFRTGKVIAKQNKYDRKHAVSFEKADEEMLCSREEWFELLHNHPGSTLPSVPDIRALIRREKAKGTTVVGHDASVYRIEKLEQISPQEFDKMADRAYTKVKEKYRGYASDSLIENETAESIITMLAELKIVNFYKL